jgi:3-phosphoshikimate 1-carboxyvinyltransferase
MAPSKNAGWKPAGVFPTLRPSMALTDPLPVPPFTRPVRGAVTLPGSKSLTNRALLLAALCDQPVTLTGALFSDDTHLMAGALRKLGFTVEADEPALTLRVAGQAQGFTVGEADLFVGLAGTAARFLTALCAAAPQGIYRLDGVPQMRKRPMKGLIDALRQLGADIRCPGEEGFFPLEIHARGLRGGTVNLDASESSQLLSALLMVAPLALAPVEVNLVSGVRRTFIEMTRRLMAEFGRPGAPLADPAKFRLTPGRYVSPGAYAIEPDATAASYFQALPCVAGGALALPGLRPPGAGLQGDSAFAEVLARVQVRPPGTRLTENFHEISDTFLTLAAIAPLLDPAHRHRAYAQAGDRPRRRHGPRAPKTRPAGHRAGRLARNPSPAAADRAGHRDLSRPPVCHELRHPRLPRSAPERPVLARDPRSGLLCENLSPLF